MEEVSSFMQAQLAHPKQPSTLWGAGGGPETPNQDSFSMEAAPRSCRQDAISGGAPVPRAGGPQAVSVQKPPCDGCSDIPSLLQSRSRAASQGPRPAGAAALPCWGHSSSQGGLAGCRNGCQLPPTESLPRMLLGKHHPASAQAWGYLSMWWQGQEFWNFQRQNDVDVKPLSRIKDLPWFLFSEKSPFQSCSGAETTQHPTDLVGPSSPVPHFGMGSSWGRSRHSAHSQWRMCKETRHP